jgi:hypothetical protein
MDIYLSHTDFNQKFFLFVSKKNDLKGFFFNLVKGYTQHTKHNHDFSFIGESLWKEFF